MANTVTNFHSFLNLLPEREREELLATVYSNASGSQLNRLISSYANKHEISINLSDISRTTPKPEEYNDRHSPSEEELHQEKRDNPASGTTGSIINNDKYEGEILDNIAEQREQTALDEFNQARTPEERQRKFQEILARYADPESAIDQQHQQLIAQLEASEQGQTLKTGEIAGSKRLKTRIEELRTQRSQERDEYTSLLGVDIVRKHHELLNLRQEALGEKNKDLLKKHDAEIKNREKDFKSLSRDQRNLIGQYDQLHFKLQYTHAGQFTDNPALLEQFSKLNNPKAQGEFLKSLIHNQHLTVRGEVGKVFDQKEKRRFSQGYKKTLTRAERRNLLNRTRSKQTSPHMSQSALSNIFRSFSKYYSPPIQRQNNSEEPNDFLGFLDKVNNAKNFIDRAQNVLDFVKNLFSSGGEVVAAESAGAAVTGGVAATSPFWGTALIVIGVVFCIILLLFIIIMVLTGNTNTGDVPSYSQIDCNDQTIKPEDIDTGDRMIKIIASKFHITVPSGVFYSPNNGSGKNVDPTKASPTPELVTAFKSICRLFGHVNGISSDNSFGRLFTSHFNNVDQNILNFSGDSSNKCSLDTESTPGSILHFTIKNPLKCTGAELEFYIDKGLAFSLAGFMQADGKGVLKDFTNAVYNTPPKLPTAGCQAPGTKSGFNKEDYCFADMVGAYATWGFQYPTDQTTSPTSPTITPTQTSGINSLLSGIGNFPDTYQLYYKFARDELFNGVDFWNTNSLLGSKLDEFADDVKTCQGPDGNNHTPDRGCINQLRVDADADFAKALDRVYPNYQCGSFVWSYEDLYGWPEMRGNGSGGVSGWYWLGPTQQKGYHWFQNPYHGGQAATIQPGDIIVYATDKVNSGDVGHVAVVKSVDRDNFHFTLDESNYRIINRQGVFTDTRIVTLDQAIVRKDGTQNPIQGWWRSDTLMSGPKQTK